MTTKKLSWLKFMWSIYLIQTFTVAALLMGAMIYQKNLFESSTIFYLSLLLPMAIMTVISYFGFYKRWKVYLSE